ncbi:MAG: class I adenylate-forming enzyme family protein [Actinomycetes bacterium]
MVVRLTNEEAQGLAVWSASGLAACGLSAGDRVAIMLPADGSTIDEAADAQAQTLGLVLGAMRMAVIPVMINPALPPRERDAQITDAQVSHVIDSTAAVAELFGAGATGRTPDLSDTPLTRPMHFTSGTTGRSKGVWTGVLTHGEAAHVWGDEQDQWQFEPTDTTLVHGPLAHSGPLRFALLALLAGGDVLLPGRFDAKRVADAMVEERPTHAFVVPSHLQRLFALPDGPPPSPYRFLTHAGAQCPAALKRRIHQWAGIQRTWEFYGSTEGQFTACHGPEWEQRPGTVGRARRGRTLTIDDGVIWCQTPAWTHFEYWGDPDKTAAAWRHTDSGSAFSVGDLGHLDDEGYLWIDGRRHDLIITGGVNVYPTQVEAALIEHPGVVDVAVFGVDDEAWGHRVCAAVVGDVSQDDLRAFAKTRLAAYQVPKSVYPVAELPRNAAGKVLRTKLPEILGLPS